MAKIVIINSDPDFIKKCNQQLDVIGDELTDIERFLSLDEHFKQYIVDLPAATGNPEDLAMRWEEENDAPLAVCHYQTAKEIPVMHTAIKEYYIPNFTML